MQPCSVNTVSSTNPNVAVVEERNYYPFGLQHHGYHETVNGQAYPYKTYQGQELVKALGLNWLTFKYRSYDPAIGRFLQVDPLAGKYPYNGVYNFSENRVIDAVEFEGLEAYRITFRSFIPQKKLPNPTPWSKFAYYKGDNRLFYTINAKKYRTEQSVELNFNNNKNFTLANSASPSYGLNASGKNIAHSLKGKAGIVSSSINTVSGKVNFIINATNKLSKSENLFTPAIDAKLNLTIIPSKNGDFDFIINIPRMDGFPAYALWVKDLENNKNYLLFGRNPINSNENVLSLYGKGEHSFLLKGKSSDFKTPSKLHFGNKKIHYLERN